MIKEFENMGRKEMIQYICLVLTYFYNEYDYLEEKEKKYINKFIKILDEVYND